MRRRTCVCLRTRQFGRHGVRVGGPCAKSHRQFAGNHRHRRAGAGTGATHATIGYDYQLSKRSSLYAYYTRLANGRNGIAGFAINSVGRETGTAGATLSGVALGIKHNF